MDGESGGREGIGLNAGGSSAHMSMDESDVEDGNKPKKKGLHARGGASDEDSVAENNLTEGNATSKAHGNA